MFTYNFKLTQFLRRIWKTSVVEKKYFRQAPVEFETQRYTYSALQSIASEHEWRDKEEEISLLS